MLGNGKIIKIVLVISNQSTFRFEIQRFPFFEEENLDCVRVIYTLTSSKTIKVNNTGIDA